MKPKKKSIRNLKFLCDRPVGTVSVYRDEYPVKGPTYWVQTKSVKGWYCQGWSWVVELGAWLHATSHGVIEVESVKAADLPPDALECMPGELADLLKQGDVQ
jgi:hypothetical protein